MEQVQSDNWFISWWNEWMDARKHPIVSEVLTFFFGIVLPAAIMFGVIPLLK